MVDSIKKELIDELQQWRLKSIDDDQKVAIISKDEMRQALGRSPDTADMFYMRVYFELEKKYTNSLYSYNKQNNNTQMNEYGKFINSTFDKFSAL